MLSSSPPGNLSDIFPFPFAPFRVLCVILGIQADEDVKHWEIKVIKREGVGVDLQPTEWKNLKQ